MHKLRNKGCELRCPDIAASFRDHLALSVSPSHFHHTSCHDARHAQDRGAAGDVFILGEHLNCHCSLIEMPINNQFCKLWIDENNLGVSNINALNEQTQDFPSNYPID